MTIAATAPHAPNATAPSLPARASRPEQDGPGAPEASAAAGSPAQPLPPFTSLPPAMPASSDDVAVFARGLATQSASASPIDQLALELSDLVEGGLGGGREAWTFDLDMPGLGRLAGRVQVRSRQAEVELQAQRPSAGAMLRRRQRELQQGLDRASGGDVSLTIV